MEAGLPSLNFGYFVIKAYGYFWTWKNETTIKCVSILRFKTLFKQTEFRALTRPFLPVKYDEQNKLRQSVHVWDGQLTTRFVLMWATGNSPEQ